MPPTEHGPILVPQALVHNIPPKEAARPHRTPSPPLTRAPATANAAKKSSIPLITPSFSLPYSFVMNSSSSIISSTIHYTLASSSPTIATIAPSIPPLPSSHSPPSTEGLAPSHQYNLCSCSHSISHSPTLLGLGITSLRPIVQSSRGAIIISI